MGADFAGWWYTRSGVLVHVLGWSDECQLWRGGFAGELVYELAWDEAGDFIGRPHGAGVTHPFDLAQAVRAAVRAGAVYR